MAAGITDVLNTSATLLDELGKLNAQIAANTDQAAALDLTALQAAADQLVQRVGQLQEDADAAVAKLPAAPPNPTPAAVEQVAGQ
jgi:hypothetical protein